MRVLVTGAGGMLGSDLVKALKAAGHRVWAMPRAELDITGTQAVAERIRLLLPDVVANCAASTAVDDCETQSDMAFRVNALGPRNLAVACQEAGAALLQISTDMVFDGTSSRPYREWDRPAPINVYGASKLAGEEMVRFACPRHWIVRTQWLYEANGASFVRTIRRLAGEKKDLAVIYDQIGSPTYTADLAEALVTLLGAPTYGTYHITNSGSCSWHDFARLILANLGLTPELRLGLAGVPDRQAGGRSRRSGGINGAGGGTVQLAPEGRRGPCPRRLPSIPPLPEAPVRRRKRTFRPGASSSRPKTLSATLLTCGRCSP